MTLAVVTLASFSVGVFANQLVVQQIQSLSGSQVLVPAPELQILSSSWSINLFNSTIVAVILNVTTVGGTTTQFKLYQIFVQLSCLKGPLPGIPGTDFTCAVGTTTITLPTNMNGASAIVKVPITPPIDPELIEVHNISFIVTGSPAPCAPFFTVTARPAFVNLTRSSGFLTANITKTITGTCGFAGPVTLTATAPAGLTVTLTPGTVTLAPNGSGFALELITASTATAPGTYKVTNCGTGGNPLITQCATVFVGVA